MKADLFLFTIMNTCLISETKLNHHLIIILEVMFLKNKVFIMMLLLLVLRANISFGSESWDDFRWQYMVPYGTEEVNPAGFIFNRLLWINKGIFVYGDALTVSGYNEFKVVKNGYYIKNAVAGEYRYHGYTFDSRLFTNIDFPNDKNSSTEREKKYWIYNIWSPSSRFNRGGDESIYNEVANSNRTDILALKIREWLNGGLSFNVKNGTVSGYDKAPSMLPSHYINVLSRPTTFTEGQGIMYHFSRRSGRVYYETITIKKISDKEIGSGSAKVLLHEATLDKNRSDDSLSVSLEISALYDDSDVYGDSLKESAYYYRQDIKSMTISVYDPIKKRWLTKVAKPAKGNSSETSMQLKYDKTEYDRHIISGRLSLRYIVKLKVDFFTGESIEKEITHNLLADKPMLENKTETAPEISFPYEMASGSKINITLKNTESVESYKGYLDGSLLSSKELETLLSGNMTLHSKDDSDTIYTLKLEAYSRYGETFFAKGDILVKGIAPKADVRVSGTLKEHNAITITVVPLRGEVKAFRVLPTGGQQVNYLKTSLNSKTFTVSGTGNLKYEYSLKNGDFEAIGSGLLDIAEDLPPISEIRTDKDSANLGEEVKIHCYADSPDGDELITDDFSIVHNDQIISRESSKEYNSVSFDKEGEYILRLSVREKGGLYSSTDKLLTVTNARPAVSFDKPVVKKDIIVSYSGKENRDKASLAADDISQMFIEPGISVELRTTDVSRKSFTAESSPAESSIVRTYKSSSNEYLESSTVQVAEHPYSLFYDYQSGRYRGVSYLKGYPVPYTIDGLARSRLIGTSRTYTFEENLLDGLKRDLIWTYAGLIDGGRNVTADSFKSETDSLSINGISYEYTNSQVPYESRDGREEIWVKTELGENSINDIIHNQSLQDIVLEGEKQDVKIYTHDPDTEIDEVSITVSHDNMYFDNSTVKYSNINVLPDVWQLPGKYIVTAAAADSVGNRTSVQAEKTVIVHRKPVASFYYLNKPVREDMQMALTLNSLAYDPDYQYRMADKGIKKSSFYISELETGPFQPYGGESLASGIYYVKQEVTDYDGASDSIIKRVYVGTYPKMRIIVAKLQSYTVNMGSDIVISSLKTYFPFPEEALIELKDSSGNIKRKFILQEPDYSGARIDTAGLPPGRYYVHMTAYEKGNEKNMDKKVQSVYLSLDLGLETDDPIYMEINSRFEINIDYNEYFKEGRLIIFEGTDFERTLYVRKGQKIITGIEKRDIPEGSYSFIFKGLSDYGTDVLTGQIMLSRPKIDGYKVFGSYDIYKDGRYMSLENVHIVVFTSGNIDKVEIRPPSEFLKHIYTDKRGYTAENPDMPEVIAMRKSEKGIYRTDMILPLVDSSIDKNRTRILKPYYIATNLIIDGKVFDTVNIPIDITGNIFDILEIK